MANDKDKVQEHSLLFADPDESFLEELKKDPKAKILPPILARIGNEAQGFIRDTQNRFAGIFISLELTQPDGMSVLRTAVQNHPRTPIFVLYEGEAPLTAAEVQKERLAGLVKKPVRYSDLVKKFVSPDKLFDPKEALEAAKQDKDEVGKPSEAKEEEFFPIKATSIVSGSKSLFDFFVKLDSGRYVKIIRAGDEFQQERLDGYVEKGVNEFYIKSEYSAQYLAYAEKITGAVVSRASISNDVKVAHVFEMGKNTLNFFRAQRILDETHVQHAVSFLNNLNGLFESIKLTQQSKLAETVLNHAESCDHGVATTILSSLVAKELGFETGKSLKVIGIAGMFHDIALIHADAVLRDEVEEKMNEYQLKQYKKHPAQSSKILSEIRGIDPLVSQSVAYHHKKRDGSGFPNQTGIGVAKVPTVSEIIGLSDAFIRQVRGREGQNLQHTLMRLDILVFAGYTPEIVSSFRKVVNLPS